MIIQLNNVTKTIGGELLFENLDMRIKEGQKVGIIGRNGCGKSTLLKMIMGIEGRDEGHLSIRNHVSIGYLSQERVSAVGLVGRDFLLSARADLLEIGGQLRLLESQFATAGDELEVLLVKYGKLQEKFEEEGGYEIESNLETIANGLGIFPLLTQQVTSLSGGEQTLLALAKVLLENPDVFLMDEPTNHLDLQGLAWLGNYMSKSKKTFLVVSHDRHFLNQVVDTIIELDYEAVVYQGNYSAYQAAKKKRMELLAKDYEEQQKEIKKIKEAIRRYRQWGHESDNEKFFKRAKHLEKRLEQMEEISRPPKEQVALMKSFNFSQRSGKEVLEFKGVSKAFAGKVLFNQLDFNLFWQDKAAILGPNGSGKSTILKMLLGEYPVDQGQIKLGSQVQVGYLSQSIDYENRQQTVLDAFRSSCQLHEEESRRTLAKYLFFKDDVFRQVGNLSGGEKVRLELAKLMQQPNNLLVLDEPTNHLDIETRELLEEVLSYYQGTLLVVSHDRYFLEKTTITYFTIDHQTISSRLSR
ncbi:ABC-F type ribosomal protection protein [Vagococcus sp. BWB3-3]|uniref:ABC-F type ribosomal protection protein n=1 Tax=Vagococcus allomyrinae TaxID=2794353 RepID=A0A940PCY1_9ENTE|nr:ABC-F type ribosomal protection protein [Vagococcus allomyrinae]MBP1040463.1 ABC-F type ribosomal protection protein [Vagococcus allomyrinae]